ncbi:MAG: DUF1833 family protein [Candidatus Micrarchaeia archaeon]|jgi:hypothetical protein
MSRDVSLAFIAAVNAQETAEAFIVLVTIREASLPNPIYLNTSGANVVSRGHIFLACPLQVTLGEDSDERLPQPKLVMDNIDRLVVAAIREAGAAGTAPVVDLELVKASDPDLVEVACTDFEMREITYNALTIEADLTLEGLFQEPACGYSFCPSYFPGLF